MRARAQCLSRSADARGLGQWTFMGSAVVTESFIRLTPAEVPPVRACVRMFVCCEYFAKSEVLGPKTQRQSLHASRPSSSLATDLVKSLVTSHKS